MVYLAVFQCYIISVIADISISQKKPPQGAALVITSNHKLQIIENSNSG